eukprot:6946048-Pyramimonas_sp.AAC.1
MKRPSRQMGAHSPCHKIPASHQALHLGLPRASRQQSVRAPNGGDLLSETPASGDICFSSHSP